MNHKHIQLLLSAFLLLVVASGCKTHSSNAHVGELYRYPGALWLSWTAAERDNFVSGFIDGYAHGMNEACLATDDLFETDVVHLIGHDDVQSTFPSSRCRARVAQYSHVVLNLNGPHDYSAYTSVLTEFYTRHPEYRDMPLVQVMDLLKGPNKVSAEDIYAKLTGRRPQPTAH